MFDLIVLGGGPGGYLAAERAGGAGLSVLLIEKNRIGGVCLNEGCIPSKTLLNSAKIYDHAKNGEKYGVTSENAKIDQAVVVARKNKVVKALVSGVTHTLKTNKVTVKEGQGMILGRENGVIRVQVGEEVFEGQRLIIATGSEAIIPPIPGVKEGLAAGTVSDQSRDPRSDENSGVDGNRRRRCHWSRNGRLLPDLRHPGHGHRNARSHCRCCRP